ncbi:MAG: threonine synthase [Chloroflexota bacterium]|nr:threonine synthase [Chloroflexota bacterium]
MSEAHQQIVTKQPRPGTSLIERYRDFLPFTGDYEGRPFTLGEGNTPLLEARRLGGKLGCRRLYLKIEGMNPTGSFKDRGMVVTVAKAMERGATMLVCASTGNTAASASAYAAAGGLRCIVVLPAGYVAAGKLAQALAYGATVLPIDGTFDRALNLVREIVERTGAELVNSLNPYRIEGQKTAAFEVCDTLGRAPDVVALPVGNAGNITAYWQGFREYREAGRIAGLPRMWGFQAAGAAPLIVGHAVERPNTIATAIRIGHPARGGQALEAVRDSDGLLAAVSDEEIMRAYRLVAAEEGVMCEPASAASLAGLLKLARQGYDLSAQTIVAVLTGHGLKDPAAALSLFCEPAPFAADLDVLLRAIGSGP